MSGDGIHVSPGHVFAGRYRLSSVLGRGAMADVWRADDEALGRPVAVKIFRDDQPLGTEQRIDAEKRTLASLSHPGLVTLYDAGAVSDTNGLVVPYLVMELVDGQTLRALLATNRLPGPEVAQIGHRLADALAYIHARGVVHRDIKPANILIARDAPSTVKLTDFGIARIVDSDRLTAHGTTVGTAHYLSPEQATGSPTGPASDIYALGLVLLESLTGRMAFEGSAVASAVARLHRDPDVPAELGPEWVILLTDMTARRPDDRPTAAALVPRLSALTRAAGGVPATAVLGLDADATGRDTTVPPSGTPMWVRAAGTAAVVAVAAAVGWSMFGPADSVVTEPNSTTTAPPTSTEIPAAEVVPPASVAPPAPTASSVPVLAPVPDLIPTQPTTADSDADDGGPGNGNGNQGNGNAGNPGGGRGSGNPGSGNSGNGNSGNGNSGNGNSGNGNSGNGNNGNR